MDRLMKVVEREHIFLSFKDLSLCPRTIYGLYFYDPRNKQSHIVLDKHLREGSPLYRSVLAEELGHHFTVPQNSFIVPYTSYPQKIALSRDEHKALLWACDFLIPINEFEKAVAHGMTTVDSLADHFNVTRWLMRRRVQPIMERSRNRFMSHAG